MQPSQNSELPIDLTECFSASLCLYCFLYLLPGLGYRKGIELTLTLILMCISISEAAQQFLLHRTQKRWEYPTLMIMTLALLANSLYCFWNVGLLLWWWLQMNCLYYLAIMGFIVFKYMEKWNSPHYRPLLLVMATIFLTCTALIMREVGQSELASSSELAGWLKGSNLFLCGIGVGVVVKNGRQQSKVLHQYQLPAQHIHNPASRLGIWVGLNTCAELLQLFNTLMLQYSQNYPISISLNLSFLLLSFGSTLWYYRGIRRSSTQHRMDQPILTYE